MKNSFRRCITIFTHLIGQGSVAFHVDFLYDLLKAAQANASNQSQKDELKETKEKATQGRVSKIGIGNGHQNGPAWNEERRMSNAGPESNISSPEQIHVFQIEGRRKQKDEPHDKSDEYPIIAVSRWKQRHLNGFQIIQGFGESLPQFLLQTAAAFLDWTSGTSKQCFPGKAGLIFIRMEP